MVHMETVGVGARDVGFIVKGGVFLLKSEVHGVGIDNSKLLHGCCKGGGRK